MMEIKIV